MKICYNTSPPQMDSFRRVLMAVEASWFIGKPFLIPLALYSTPQFPHRNSSPRGDSSSSLYYLAAMQTGMLSHCDLVCHHLYPVLAPPMLVIEIPPKPHAKPAPEGILLLDPSTLSHDSKPLFTLSTTRGLNFTVSRGDFLFFNPSRPYVS
jgi:hypothetical protein